MMTAVQVLLAIMMLCAGFSCEGMLSLATLPEYPVSMYDPSTNPPHELHKQGISLERWMELFEGQVQQLGISLPDDGFQRVADVTFTESKDLLIESEYHYTTYWLRSGEAALFLRAFEEETITDVYVCLNQEFPMESNTLAVQIQRFSLLMRACVYACEEGHVTETDIDQVMDQFANDIVEAVYGNSSKIDRYLLNWPEYTFQVEATPSYKWIIFSMNWLR